jgi:Homeobox KN domain
MKATLRERLVRLEQQFLLAVAANNEDSLNIFAQEWSKLAHDIQSGKVDGGLDEDTALLLSQVSQAIESTMCCMLECNTILQEALSGSIGQFILGVPPGDQSRISHRPQECHLLFSRLPSSTAPGILGQQRLLDSYAYRWLMQNIHNPYPTSMQMQIRGDVSMTSVAQVELWFQEVRDSIGWTKLSHEFFAGSIGATVAAARRVYLKGGMNVSFDVIFAFTSAKAFAETLFLEHLPLQAEHVEEDVAQTSQSVGTGFGDPSEKNVYAPSASNLSTPSDAFSWLSVNKESEVEDTTPPPSVVGRKRRLTEDISQVPGLQRPEKRLRCVLLYQLLPLTELCMVERQPVTLPFVTQKTRLVHLRWRHSHSSQSQLRV